MNPKIESMMFDLDEAVLEKYPNDERYHNFRLAVHELLELYFEEQPNV